MKERDSQTGVEEPIRIRKANDYAKEFKDLKPSEMLFDEFWREGELALLFGSSGAGKSILAVQIAEALARGRAIEGFRMPARGRGVLYVDMEMSDAQFVRRNSAAAGESLKLHTFSERFVRESPPDADKLAEWLRQAVRQTRSRVVVIDSLSSVKTTQDGVRETLKLMRELRRLRDELNISILVVTDCTDARRGKPLTEADLGRSRIICSAADSVVAICRHPTHFDQRYIVQTRSRNAAICWTEKNAPLCSITKRETGLLAFNFDDRFVEKLDEDDVVLICNLKVARDEGGESYRSMAELFEITRSRAERLYKKWSPAIEARYREIIAVEPTGSDSCVARRPSPNAAIAGDPEVEAEEWEEAGFERPEWLDFERDDGSRTTGAECQNEERSVRDASPGMDVHAIPFAAGLRRRSVYDLERSFDAYGREIFIEERTEPGGKPAIWYQIDRKGNLMKSERGRAGIIITNLGKTTYL